MKCKLCAYYASIDERKWIHAIRRGQEGLLPGRHDRSLHPVEHSPSDLDILRTASQLAPNGAHGEEEKTVLSRYLKRCAVQEWHRRVESGKVEVYKHVEAAIIRQVMPWGRVRYAKADLWAKVISCEVSSGAHW
jgi:hypothetical protein